MKLLVADDDAVSQGILAGVLGKCGYEVVTAKDGQQAWELLQADPDIGVAVLDWMMPGYSGVELCRMIRLKGNTHYLYVVLVTSRAEQQDVVDGLVAGADDYVTKPFNASELRLRVGTGARIVQLERHLAAKVAELQHALEHVNQLKGLLPICMDCKRVRDDQNYWHELDSYLTRYAGADFTHSLCPECLEKRCGPPEDSKPDDKPKLTGCAPDPAWQTADSLLEDAGS
jgi:CheY-like chemotaxis protein